MYLAFDKGGLVKTIAGIAAFWLVAYLVFKIPADLTQWLRLISTTILFTTITISALNFGWKQIWKWFPALNRLVFPDLSGTWKTEMHSNISVIGEHHPDLCGKKLNSHIEGKFEIYQSLFSITISFDSNNKYSNSRTVFVKPTKDKETGEVMLRYLYDNHTPKQLPTDEQYHGGAACLRVLKDEDVKRMEGVYWTNRNWPKGLNTAGQITATKL